MLTSKQRAYLRGIASTYETIYQVGKGGVKYPRRSAICLETMHFPNSPNLSQFPSTVLRPGEIYKSRTLFRFSTDPPQMFKE